MTHSLLSRLKLSAITLITLITVGCGKSVDDERVPYSEVHISFTDGWRRIVGAGKIIDYEVAHNVRDEKYP